MSSSLVIRLLSIFLPSFPAARSWASHSPQVVVWGRACLPERDIWTAIVSPQGTDVLSLSPLPKAFSVLVHPLSVLCDAASVAPPFCASSAASLLHMRQSQFETIPLQLHVVTVVVFHAAFPESQTSLDAVPPLWMGMKAENQG